MHLQCYKHFRVSLNSCKIATNCDEIVVEIKFRNEWTVACFKSKPYLRLASPLTIEIVPDDLKAGKHTRRIVDHESQGIFEAFVNRARSNVNVRRIKAELTHSLTNVMNLSR